jgi:putative transposase
VSAFIAERRSDFGVERICRVLGVSASAFYRRASGEQSARVIEDERLLGRIRELHAANYFAYGYRRMWKALLRAGETAPRCKVQRLMRAHAIVGAKRRGRPWRTTRPDPLARCPALSTGARAPLPASPSRGGWSAECLRQRLASVDNQRFDRCQAVVAPPNT